MSDQFYIPGTEPPEVKERAYLNDLLPDMETEVQAHGGPPELLRLNHTKAYTAVFLGNLTAFRLCLRGDRRHILVPYAFRDLIPTNWTKRVPKGDQKYILVPIERPMDDYSAFLVSLAGAAVDRYPKEWDCCSMYLACSDAKVCVHTDKKLAMVCGYRKVLSSGKVYYGKNRNV